MSVEKLEDFVKIIKEYKDQEGEGMKVEEKGMKDWVELFEVIEKKCLYQNKVFVDSSPSPPLTYKKTFECLKILNRFFKKTKIQAQSKVIICSNSYRESSVLILSCIREGVCPILVPPMLVENITEHPLLKDLVVFIDKSIFCKMKERPQFFYLLDETTFHEKNCFDMLKSLFQSKKHLKNNLTCFSRMSFKKKNDRSFHFNNLSDSALENNPLWVLMSSGTTGPSKLAPMNRKNILIQMDLLKKTLNFDETTRLYNADDPLHIDGCLTGILLTFFSFASLISDQQKAFSLRINKCLQNLISIFKEKKTTVALLNPVTISFF